MALENYNERVDVDLEFLREEIAQIQSLDLEAHSQGFEAVHTQLEKALRSIDGK